MANPIALREVVFRGDNYFGSQSRYHNALDGAPVTLCGKKINPELPASTGLARLPWPGHPMEAEWCKPCLRRARSGLVAGRYLADKLGG